MAEKNISICGLDCTACPAFVAHEKNDDALRKKTAKKWAKFYPDSVLRFGDINCTGCLADSGVKFTHCLSCGVRKCAQAVGVKNCGICLRYPCDKIANLHNSIPDGKKACDYIHETA